MEKKRKDRNEKTFLLFLVALSFVSVRICLTQNPINICFDVLILIWCYVTQSGFEIATKIILMQIIYKKKERKSLVYVFCVSFWATKIRRNYYNCSLSSSFLLKIRDGWHGTCMIKGCGGNVLSLPKDGDCLEF